MAALYQVDTLDHIGAGASVLTVKDFSFTYEGAGKPAITEADFTLERGQVTLLLGRNGSGKTTLLRNLKPILAPRGERAGRISFLGKDLGELSPREGVGDIGFVFQNPDAQLVMETVYEELAFGLENLGLAAEKIRTTIADTVSFCGIEHLLEEKTADLSGGQKQLVNLCAVLCLRPKLLLLDEPFSQLDPESARRMVEVLRRLGTETGVAILLSEQRLEEVWSLTDQVIYLDKGETLFCGSPREFAAFGRERADGFGLPLVSRIFAASGKELYHLPLSLKEGQSLLAAWGIDTEGKGEKGTEQEQLGDIVFQGNEVSFCFPNAKKIILKQISLKLHQGERLVICGSNGAGKTTLLRTMAGIIKPLQGRWQLTHRSGAVSYLAQQCQYHFRYDTPYQEFLAIDKGCLENEDFMWIIGKLGVNQFLEEDLYTLSLGQQQRVALAMTLAKPAAVYLLDEPTRGLDEENKQALGEILQAKTGSGIVLATHDLEFAADWSSGFTTLMGGRLTPIQRGEDFFTDRYWQTTVGAKLFGRIAQEWGWYSAGNIPQNWADLLAADDKEKE